jgi:Spy/CpxP family protein refolding chaperone
MERVSMKRRLSTVLGAVLLALAIPFGVAPAAHAADGNIYMVFPTWLGNCPGGGKSQ